MEWQFVDRRWTRIDGERRRTPVTREALVVRTSGCLHRQPHPMTSTETKPDEHDQTNGSCTWKKLVRTHELSVLVIGLDVELTWKIDERNR